MKIRTLITCCAIGAASFGQAQTTPDSSNAAPVTPDTTKGVYTSAPDTSNLSASPSSSPDTGKVATSAPAEGALLASAAPANKVSAGAQAKALTRANTLYNKQAYGEAIPYYEKARQGENSDKLILMKLGDCYRLTNNVNGKLHCYGELVRSGHALPIHNLYYAQALVEVGEPDKAKEFFEKYTTDVRGIEMAMGLAKMKSYSKNADAYSVKFAGFNSMQNDYCAVKFFDAVVFTTARAKTSWIKRQQGWTDGDFMNLYAAEKLAGMYMPAAPFMGDLNSKFNDGPITFTKDYNTVYFTRNNSRKDERAADGTFKLKILEANLDQNGFSMVKVMSFSNKDYNFAHPSVSADGTELYFASDREGTRGGMDIWVTHKDSAGNWGMPINLGDKVNTPGNEIFPSITPNGVLYFSSDGHEGMGALDIYETKKVNGVITRIYNMGEPVNSRFDDFGYYISEDLKNGFISSNRKTGGMDDDVYELELLRDVKRGKELTIIARNKETAEPVDSAKFVINGDTVIANDKGEYILSLEDETEYQVEAMKDDYFKTADVFNAKMNEADEFTKDILLEKDPKLFLRALITDAKTGELLEGASIRLTDLATNSEVDKYTTTSSGDYFKFLFGNRIGDKLAYLVRVEKPGYLQRTAVFTHEITKPGEVNMNEAVNLSLGKVEVGMDLAKMIDMKPIYFDMGKSTIRKDAAIELDKIVQVMNEYPNMIIELGSHTDCRSGAASNLKLSNARAKASANYIIKKGVNKLRIAVRVTGRQNS